ncbi:TIGR04282 family arsenosugar biosynthesis glycosyltransferase [Candidatus Methylobacter favarea]
MIFCKAPVPGQVKTRLLPALTPGQAADIHIELTIRTLQLATQNNLCPVQLWCTPTTDQPFFMASAAAYRVVLQQQQGFGLGERMHHAFGLTLGTYSQALLIGCDCPSLTERDLEEAITALSREKCCALAPAEDGGYVLIGLNRLHPKLFADIPWGTAGVLNETRARIARFNLRCHELQKQWDVDTPKDLARYRALNLTEKKSSSDS